MNSAIVTDGVSNKEADTEAKVAAEKWYGANRHYQYPGGLVSFNNCSNKTGVEDYGSFTQVSVV